VFVVRITRLEKSNIKSNRRFDICNIVDIDTVNVIYQIVKKSSLATQKCSWTSWGSVVWLVHDVIIVEIAKMQA